MNEMNVIHAVLKVFWGGGECYYVFRKWKMD